MVCLAMSAAPAHLAYGAINEHISINGKYDSVRHTVACSMIRSLPRLHRTQSKPASMQAPAPEQPSPRGLGGYAAGAGHLPLPRGAGAEAGCAGASAFGAVTSFPQIGHAWHTRHPITPSPLCDKLTLCKP